MEPNWKVAKKPVRRHKPPRLYVSLSRRGEIALNPQAWAAIRAPASVTLLYDESQGRIGVKCPVPLDRHFFPVRRYGRNGKGRVIYAARLLKQFDITIPKTLVFRNPPIESRENHPMLILDLRNANNGT